MTAASNTAHIVLLSGDGIGPEVIESAAAVLQCAARLGQLELRLEEGWIGGAAIDRCGDSIAPDTLESCLKADAVLLGAVGGPRWEHLPGHLRPETGLLRLRSAMKVYANLRPVRSRSALAAFTPYRPEILAGVDIMMIRELTGGLYFGERHRSETEAFDTCRYSKIEVERIARVAGRAARARKGRLCSIDKANVLDTSRLWRQVMSETIAREFPELILEHILVDAAAMYLAQRPASFDVIVTENLFGDILSDQSSTLAGSLGLLPSASLGDGTRGLYEPIHGSAPSIAGRGIANPIGAILSVALLFRYSLGHDHLARMIEDGVEEILDGSVLTPDLDPDSRLTTSDVTRMLCAVMSRHQVV